MRLDHLARTVARGIVPFGDALRAWKRRMQPYEDDPDNSHHCIGDGMLQIATLRRAGIPIEGAAVLDFGSGWMPLIPLLFHLAGARKVVMTDILRLADEATTALARRRIATRIGEIAALLERPEPELLARLEGPFAPDYLVPWDAAAHPAGSLDILLSRAVLEHVPIAALRDFMAQFHRILRPGGAMVHIIDNSDHWQHQDAALSRIDMLRYEEGSLVWRLAQINPQGYQNRLRHGDYARMLREAGFEILHDEGEADPRCLADLASLPLASRFRGHDPADLAVLTSVFLARRG